jgi:hypothetical protein
MSSQTMSKVFLSLCETADTPVSLSAWLQFKYSHESLAGFRLNPRDYTDPAAFSKDYLISTFLRKWKGLVTGIDTGKVAIDKFRLADEQCLSTNRRLLGLVEDPSRSRAEAILHSAKRKISAILGPFSLKNVLHRCEWTKGATLDVPKKAAFVDTKMLKLPITVTRRALPWYRLQKEFDPRWFEALSGVYPDGPFSLVPTLFKVVDGNRVTTVPKDSSTDRVIAVEPRANIFLQKGVGNFIRGRLRKFGIDLSKQEINQFWAEMAQSLDLSTLDLSSASDTIAKELVFELLPIDWAVYLDDIRSPFGTLPDGSKIKYEKFSSMGNGFTFELESLIFFALCESTQDLFRSQDDWRLTSVYGDDIIIPRSAYREVCETLRYFGFEVNSKKSYEDGQFFESCGKHYFSGRDVTPVYQKELLDEIEAVRCANRLQRWGVRTSFFKITRGAWHHLWEDFTLLHGCAIPIGAEGDDGWVQPLEKFRKYDPNHGYHCRVIRFMKRSLPAQNEALLAYSLRRLSWRSNVSYRGDSNIPVPETGTYPSWYLKPLAERLGYLDVEHNEGLSDILEIESARFTFGWRWIHTSEVASS